MKIRKGVIAAAGKGTRFLPSTKAVPKEMLPVVDKPIIQYIVEEFVAAGITDIVIVTSAKQSAIRDHFSRNLPLEQFLRKNGKTALAEQIKKISSLARFTFVEQQGPYGNGTPCLNAAKFIGREPFLYAFGDDLVLSRVPFAKQMNAAYQKRPGIYAGVQAVPRAAVSKYGIVVPRASGKHGEMIGIVEKPEPKHAPSRLAEFGRFILPPEIFGILARKKLGKGNELWLVDAISELIRQGEKAYYKEIEGGKWYTTGDPASYLAAVRAYAARRKI